MMMTIRHTIRDTRAISLSTEQTRNISCPVLQPPNQMVEVFKKMVPFYGGVNVIFTRYSTVFLDSWWLTSLTNETLVTMETRLSLTNQAFSILWRIHSVPGSQKSPMSECCTACENPSVSTLTWVSLSPTSILSSHIFDHPSIFATKVLLFSPSYLNTKIRSEQH